MAVDAGCGGGLFAELLARRAERVVAFDTSFTMLVLTRRRLRRAGVDNVLVVRADLCRPPLGARSADLVLSVNALHHTEIDVSLPALASLVADGGRLAVRDLVSRTPRLRKTVPVAALHSLRRVARSVLSYGVCEGLRLGRFLLHPLWLRPRAGRPKLTPAGFGDACRRLLPGCRVGPLRRDAMTVVWEPGSVSSAARAPAGGSPGEEPRC